MSQIGIRKYFQLSFKDWFYWLYVCIYLPSLNLIVEIMIRKVIMVILVIIMIITLMNRNNNSDDDKK